MGDYRRGFRSHRDTEQPSTSSSSAASLDHAESCPLSPARVVFEAMYSNGPALLLSEENSPSIYEHPGTGADVGPSRSAKRPADQVPSSRKKNQRGQDSFEDSVQSVLHSCSATLNAISHKADTPVIKNDCTAGAQWIESKLALLSQKLRCEVMHKINQLLYEAEMKMLE
ncbi:uncharacterized protein LOC115324866 [Ixodes scapularis]|uniref:uncharacterized protein LOC115324866 n=1 Tax=Ixodes scapularis TaxID=6945 RepID=UPI0011619B6A|nr:uncharacterized protein LOC115324866 [Ixodes scapularis]